MLTSDPPPSLLRPQEPETDQEVPAGPGAAGQGGGRGGQEVPGQGEDGLHVPAQLLQDGVRLQVGGLHVPPHGAAPRPAGKAPPATGRPRSSSHSSNACSIVLSRPMQRPVPTYFKLYI